MADVEETKTKEEIKEKKQVEKTVDPQSNATFTKLVPGPDGPPGDFVATPDGGKVLNPRKSI